MIGSELAGEIRNVGGQLRSALPVTTVDEFAGRHPVGRPSWSVGR